MKEKKTMGTIPETSIEFRNRAQFNQFVDFEAKGVRQEPRDIVRREMAQVVPDERAYITYQHVLSVARTLKSRFEEVKDSSFRVTAQATEEALLLMSQMPAKYERFRKQNSGAFRYF